MTDARDELLEEIERVLRGADVDDWDEPADAAVSEAIGLFDKARLNRVIGYPVP